MKFKDKVILIFLLAVLLYAVCCRNNILPFSSGCGAAKGENSTLTTEDSLHKQVTEFPYSPTGKVGNLSEI